MAAWETKLVKTHRSVHEHVSGTSGLPHLKHAHDCGLSPLFIVDPDCGKIFPVMNDVAGWRLYEDWVIVLIDATRKTLIRFSTPDNAYVAEPETDGISTIVKTSGALEN